MLWPRPDAVALRPSFARTWTAARTATAAPAPTAFSSGATAVYRLSPRERQVLQLVAHGHRNTQIATELFDVTVRGYLGASLSVSKWPAGPKQFRLVFGWGSWAPRRGRKALIRPPPNG